MRRIAGVGVVAFLALLLAIPAAAQATQWDIDRAHSAASFAVRHLGVSTVRGGFSNITGSIMIDDADVTKSTVDVTIDVNSISTQNERRDAHLKSADFFDAANHPTITFKSKKVERAGADRLKVTGDLTLRGTTKEVVLDVEGPTKVIGNKRGASATTQINRREFGLVWGRVTEGIAQVGDEVSITIDLELNKPKPPAQ